MEGVQLPGVAAKLVGREKELQQLKAYLDEARNGMGRLVLLAGESGIGKERLAMELLDR